MIAINVARWPHRSQLSTATGERCGKSGTMGASILLYVIFVFVTATA
jgi:hypothetical protein